MRRLLLLASVSFCFAMYGCKGCEQQKPVEPEKENPTAVVPEKEKEAPAPEVKEKEKEVAPEQPVEQPVEKKE